MHCSGSNRARSDDRHRGTLSDVTCTSPQSACFSCTVVTTWPACVSSTRSADSSLGGRWIWVSSRKNVPSGHSLKLPNENSGSLFSVGIPVEYFMRAALFPSPFLPVKQCGGAQFKKRQRRATRAHLGRS